MIKPISASVLNPYFNQRGFVKNEKMTEPTVSTGMELSDSNVGRAMLAALNVNFKANNTNEPKEITSLLNKNADSSNGLNLSDVHVYEFPDTNLRLFVHADKNFPVDETPYVSVYLDKIGGNGDFVSEKLFHNVLEERAKKTAENPILASCTGVSAYTLFYEENSLSKLNDYYGIFTNDVTEEELNNAKTKLLEFVDSAEYKKDYSFAHKYFNKEKFLTKDELKTRLACINPQDFNKYCEDYIKTCAIQASVLMSKKEFETMDVADLGKGLTSKFTKERAVSVDNYILPSGVESKVVTDENQLDGYMSLGFSLNDNDEKKYQTKFLAIELLSKRFEDTATFYSTIDALPLTTKTRSRNPYVALLQVRFKQDETKSIDEQVFTFRDELFSVIENEDFTEDLEQIKAKRKAILENLFSREDSQPIMKHMELARYSTEIFTVNSVIDSISQDDVKNFIKEYLIGQMPVVTVSEPNK